MSSDVLANLAVFIQANTQQFESRMSKTEKTMDGFSKKIDTVGGVLAGLFAVDQLAGFGKQVIKTTAEFEKLKAVLTTTLGSSGAADLAFQQIQEFASKTPFQVQQLTDSFVKLANQGFKPTTNEMRSLGDLAASTGKDFNQLTEALIDAQVGEFERLKEFGIRASKSGDQVKFTFKGVEQQVKFTDSAIREYILGLGETEGVSGSMAAVSETLGGKLSNLQDSFDSLFYTLGQNADGVLPKVIDKFIELTNAVNEAFKSTQDQAKFFIKTETIDAAEKRLLQLRVTLNELKAKYEEESNGPSLFGLERTVSEDDIKQVAEAIQQQFFAIQQLKKAKQDEAEASKLQAEQAELAAKQAELEKGILGRLADQLKEVTKLRDSSNSEGEIQGYNARIEKIQEEIKRLKDLTATKEIALASASGKGLISLTPEVDEQKKIQKRLNDLGINYEIPVPIVASGGLNALVSVQEEFAKAEERAKAFGDSFDLVGEKTKILNDAINQLIDSGFGGDGGPVAALQSMYEEIEGVTLDFTNQMNSMFAGLAVGFGQALGNMMASGQGFDPSFLLLPIADMAVQLGQLAIATGVAMLGIEAALKSLNPAVAIAGGIALVALGTAVRGAIGNISTGGGGSTPGIGGNSKPAAFIGNQGADENNQLEFVIKGNNLVAMMSKAQQQKYRLG